MKKAIDSAGRPRGGCWRGALRVVAVVAVIGAGGLALSAGVSAAAAAPARIHVDAQPNHPQLVGFDVVVPDPHPSEDPSDYSGYSGGGAGAVSGSSSGGGGISFTDVWIALVVVGGIFGLYALRSSRS